MTQEIKLRNGDILVSINGYSGDEGLDEAAAMTAELLQRYASATQCEVWRF